MNRSFFLKRSGLFLGLLLLASCRTMAGDDGGLLLPRLRADAEMPAPNAQLTGRLVRDGALLRLARDGGGTTIIVWPYTATLQGRGVGINTVVIWPGAVGSGTPVRVGDEVELLGIIVTIDNITGRVVDCPRDRGCTGPAFVATEFRPAPAEPQ